METVKELESYFVRNLGYMIAALNDKEDMSAEETKEYKAAMRLIEICQAERDGRCVVLPFRVGARFWSTEILRNGVCEVEVTAFCVDPKYPIWSVYANAVGESCSYEFIMDDIGKTVFLTREAAETALKEVNDHDT